MQAIILAAGMGKRLKELTSDVTKCMVKVNEKTMIERMLGQLDELNLDRIVMVVGYHAEKLENYVNSLDVKTPIEYVLNDVYYKTNNIYSLYLARDYLVKENTLILESDLIFDDGILEDLVNDEYPDLALVAKFESWMDGTVVTIDENNNNIINFIDKQNFSFEDIPNYYKTVNIYKFSKEFSQNYYVPFLEAYIKALGENEYYEQVLKVISNLKNPSLKVKKLEDKNWYEIDNVQDLNIAESIFSKPEEKLDKFNRRYGGYWRYPKLLDYCYLVNPYYPPKSLTDEIKSNFETLLENYPSGMEINSLLAANYFDVDSDQLCVGNGAAELIKSLMENVLGDEKLGVIAPTFEEYPNRLDEENIVRFYPKDFKYDFSDIIGFFEDKNIDMLVLINPDNPSGNYISKENVLKLAEWCKEHSIRLVVDESFIDFSDIEEDPTFIKKEILEKYPELIIVKSISKSFGVPGLRLGIAVSNDKDLIENMKKDVSIWNINSFAEFYLQIFDKYKADYEKGLESFKQTRNIFEEGLSSINNLEVFPSQANYFMCEVKGDITSRELASILLNDHDIYIKDLSNKNGFDGRSFIRLAVRTKEDNEKLVNALKDILDD
ncbi:MAG: aminotransferase class I/II-fold pyridoxal phosphate-dependent enzyme [Methanobrevibacter sp.]|uniref:aminotransferase class I/II-fold pyridoxal phosphate-dependent enzyme n=1 Tax=Methanobrevibacter sp. TaxID=66852 RepID=UPI0026DFF1D5|nr:aminotransferase class I/II-fold pyridoxal phosphate-dependent enzyme [Methanobrevibacter sp.]MDO5849534.1 aminotransferase class I/II-fold pyridoxal phosphate-dependent enzyme [Methanobrevibacter sp.]